MLGIFPAVRHFPGSQDLGCSFRVVWGDKESKRKPTMGVPSFLNRTHEKTHESPSEVYLFEMHLVQGPQREWSLSMAKPGCGEGRMLICVICPSSFFGKSRKLIRNMCRMKVRCCFLHSYRKRNRKGLPVPFQFSLLHPCKRDVFTRHLRPLFSELSR